MADMFTELQSQLKSCQSKIYVGFTSVKSSGISWLNDFCAEFLKFTNKLHKFLVFDCPGKDETIESIFLCLTQILTCIHHLEMIIKCEESGGIALSSSRQHFLDRVLWCFARLKLSLNSVNDNVIPTTEELNFVDLVDEALELLELYSADYNEQTKNEAELNAQAMFNSKQIRSTVDLVLGHTLSFANVANQNDKKALSALCQKVLRECISFEEECSLGNSNPNINNLNLKAAMLENALYQLEDFLNESLIRLVFSTFNDYNKLSVNNLRELIRRNPDESTLDEKIADFDVNVDRTTQIGIFAIAFAPNVKVKTTVRSCLASFESLDSSLIPSLQTNSDVESEILEQHFNEEILKFKLAIQEIIDTDAFCNGYLDILNELIRNTEVKFVKGDVSEILQMGEILIDHLTLNYDNLEFKINEDKRLNYEHFLLMAKECQAVMACADQVDEKRILKRLKIFRSVLYKLRGSIKNNAKPSDNEKTKIEFITSEDLAESASLFDSFGISPTITNILYKKENSVLKNISGSMRGNYSQIPLSPLSSIESKSNISKVPKRRGVHRNESLRTAMFKRQKSDETEAMYKMLKDNSSSLHISDILDQITELSSSFSRNSNLANVNQ